VQRRDGVQEQVLVLAQEQQLVRGQGQVQGLAQGLDGVQEQEQVQQLVQVQA
jgi:hypothetical protein